MTKILALRAYYPITGHNGLIVLLLAITALFTLLQGEAGKQGSRGWGVPLVVVGGVPWGGMPRACHRGTPRAEHAPSPTPEAGFSRLRRQELASGLRRARRARVGGGREAALAASLPYLRPFSPGNQNQPFAVPANDWIGSRSKPAQGRLSVQGLVGLSLRCASRLIRPRGATSVARSDVPPLLAALVATELHSAVASAGFRQ